MLIKKHVRLVYALLLARYSTSLRVSSEHCVGACVCWCVCVSVCRPWPVHTHILIEIAEQRLRLVEQRDGALAADVCCRQGLHVP